MLFGKKKKKDKNNIKPVLPQPLYEGEPISKTIAIINDNVNLEFGAATTIGKREYQQDAIIIPTDSNLNEKNGKLIAILSDGMGGMDNGDVASNICTNGIFNDFYSENEITDYPEFLKSEIVKYDMQIYNLTNQQGEKLNSGATLLCCIVDQDKAYWASVGDSHIYVIRNNEIIQVNNDHNYMYQLEEKVRRGEITAQQAENDPYKETLISYMGMGGIHLLDLTEEPFMLKSNDIIVLCSDGLYRALSDEVIKEIISIFEGNIQNACDELIQTVIQRDRPYQDNTSVIVIKYL